MRSDSARGKRCACRLRGGLLCWLGWALATCALAAQADPSQVGSAGRTAGGGASTTAGIAQPVTGLDFPGSAAAGGTVRFQFTNPLPIYPATYIWRVRPSQQAGYYTAFFWGNNGNFYWDRGSPNSYYGAHPYPNPPPNGTAHRWEIATGGGDYLSSEPVAYDRWYTQALRVWADRSGKHHEFYWDLPDTTKVIRVTEPPKWGETMPPSPVLVWGDAPWNPSKEVLHGVLRGIQIYTAALPVQAISAEIGTPLSTEAGRGNVWYLKLNPGPNDISDQSGKGNHPSWVGSQRPGLWRGPP